MVFEKTLSLLGYRKRDVQSEDENRHKPTRRLTENQSSPTQPRVKTYITQEKLSKFVMRNGLRECAMISAMTKTRTLLQYNIIIMKRGMRAAGGGRR